MFYNGKEVYTAENFSYQTVKVGDYVEQEVVDDAMDMLPPACMSSSCSQIGEPYDHKLDPHTHSYRPTFATFKKVANGVWQYCGNCFRGETVERGEELPIIKAQRGMK